MIPSNFPPEVIPYDEWIKLKPGPRNMFSGWIKGAFGSGKKEMQESMHQNLNFTLSTAPMWDRFVAVSILPVLNSPYCLLIPYTYGAMLDSFM